MTPSLSSTIEEDGTVDFGNAEYGALKRVIQFDPEDGSEIPDEEPQALASALREAINLDAQEHQALSDEALRGKKAEEIREIVVGLLETDPEDWGTSETYNAREVTAYVEVVRGATNSVERERVLQWGYDPAKNSR